LRLPIVPDFAFEDLTRGSLAIIAIRNPDVFLPVARVWVRLV